jgi:hypothetical protein
MLGHSGHLNTTPYVAPVAPTRRRFFSFAALTSLSFSHPRPCPKHSVDLHLMLRTIFAHFEASIQQPAHSFVVLNSGVSSTFTCCFAASATSFTGTRRFPFPVGPKCADSYITTSNSCSLTDFQDDPVLSLFQSQCQIASKLCCVASQPQTEPATRSPMLPCAHQLMQPSPPC